MFGNKSNSQDKSLIAIVSSEHVRDELQFITAKLDDVSSALKFTEDTLRDARDLVNGSADIVIVEADLSNPESANVIQKLNDYVSQNGSLIVLAENVTPANTRQMFKMGVNDVLELPVTRDELLKSLESAFGDQIKKQQNFEKAGQVITLMKSGGGVGATTLATNLAHGLMADGQPKKTKFGKKSKVVALPRVAIFDFDIQFGNVAVSLNMDTRTSILDVRKAEDRLDAELLAATIRPHESGLNVLSSPSDIVPFEAFSPDFFAQLIQIARAMFDYVIIDMPQAWTEWTQAILDQSDLIVPVLTPSVEHVHNCQKILQGLDHLKVSRKKSLVIINKITKGVAAKDRIAQIKKVMERDIALMRDDQKVHLEARDRGVLLHEISGNSGTLKNLSQCRSTILEKLQETRADISPKVGHRASDNQQVLRA